MRMTEIMSFMDLSVFPIIALIFFLSAFIAIVWRALSKSKEEIHDAASIVLNDDTVVTPRITLVHKNQGSESTEGASNV
jgi:cbb3-type cytochrome oxidase subunit 3